MTEENKDLEEQKNIEDSKVVDEQYQSFDDSYEPEDFEDENSSEGLLTGARYDVPDSKDGFINTGDGSIINKEDLSPFEIIKAIAKENGTKIQDPKKSCKHCHERGYEGMDSKTKMPIPCRCLFRGKTENEKESDAKYDASNNQGKISRATKRRMQKLLLSNYKLQRKFMLKRLDDGKNINEEPVEKTEDEVNKEIAIVVAKYDELKSFKKTALALNFTKTKVEKLLKASKTPKEVVETSDVKGE